MVIYPLVPQAGSTALLGESYIWRGRAEILLYNSPADKLQFMLG